MCWLFREYGHLKDPGEFALFSFFHKIQSCNVGFARYVEIVVSYRTLVKFIQGENILRLKGMSYFKFLYIISRFNARVESGLEIWTRMEFQQCNFEVVLISFNRK